MAPKKNDTTITITKESKTKELKTKDSKTKEPEELEELKTKEPEVEESEEDEESEDEDMEESIVREYVEKVSAPSNTEGADNKTSIVAKKNDMGGTSANIVKGGTENGAGKVSPKGKLPHADQYENVPGAKAGNAFAKKESAKTKEEGGVAKQSPLAK